MDPSVVVFASKKINSRGDLLSTGFMVLPSFQIVFKPKKKKKKVKEQLLFSLLGFKCRVSSYN